MINPVKGFVVLGDNYDPGWRVWVDGREGEVLRANYSMRAVALEPGSHRIFFSYRPRLVLAGLACSALGWAAILISILVLLPTRKRRSRLIMA